MNTKTKAKVALKYTPIELGEKYQEKGFTAYVVKKGNLIVGWLTVHPTKRFKGQKFDPKTKSMEAVFPRQRPLETEEVGYSLTTRSGGVLVLRKTNPVHPVVKQLLKMRSTDSETVQDSRIIQAMLYNMNLKTLKNRL